MPCSCVEDEVVLLPECRVTTYGQKHQYDIRLSTRRVVISMHVDRVVMLAVAAYIYEDLPHSDMYSPSRVHCSLVMHIISVG